MIASNNSKENILHVIQVIYRLLFSGISVRNKIDAGYADKRCNTLDDHIAEKN